MSTQNLEDLIEHIADQFSDCVLSSDIEKGEAVIEIDCLSIDRFLQFLKEDSECNFEQLMDITAVDYPARGEHRFEVVYNLLSLSNNQRIRIKAKASEDVAVPSVTPIYSAANWFEREVWDLFGIKFDGHPDHRRIVTDYGFEGHPLRKDFPLTGFVELRYDEAQSRVVYEPVELQQDFRNFDFVSPWEGMIDVQLPGDEKATKPEHGWRSSRGENS